MLALSLALAPRIGWAVTGPAGGPPASHASATLLDTLPERDLSEQELRRAIKREERALRRSGGRRYSEPTDDMPLPGGAGVASFALAVLGVVMYFAAALSWTPGPYIVIMGVAGLLALIFGAIGMKRRRQNRGLAIAGFVVGVLVTALILLAIVLLATLGF